jgi:hypothetical protein
MSDPTSPRSVLESLLQGISVGKWNDLADLYAQDAVVEMPFAPSAPTRLEGREAVRAHFAAAAGGPLGVPGSRQSAGMSASWACDAEEDEGSSGVAGVAA